jgi:uncharacterized protein (UPF0332 family)
MAKSREDLVRWSLEKAEEYLESASINLQNDRLYPVAEELFRVIETSLEAMLYHYGVTKIEYPGRKKFTGRLALQFLIRDTLMNLGRIDRETYNKYLEFASELHKAGYNHGKTFDREPLKEALVFAEELFYKAKVLK